MFLHATQKRAADTPQKLAKPRLVECAELLLFACFSWISSF